MKLLCCTKGIRTDIFISLEIVIITNDVLVTESNLSHKMNQICIHCNLEMWFYKNFNKN